jgi:hypothetical protein
MLEYYADNGPWSRIGEISRESSVSFSLPYSSIVRTPGFHSIDFRLYDGYDVGPSTTSNSDQVLGAPVITITSPSDLSWRIINPEEPQTLTLKIASRDSSSIDISVQFEGSSNSVHIWDFSRE